MSRAPVLQRTDCGLYCPQGDFYIDPWRPVERAVITHAHSDHARTGHTHYLAHTDSEGTLRTRLGHELVFDDPEGSDPPKVTIKTSGNHTVVLNDDKKAPSVAIQTSGNQTVTLKDGSSPSIHLKDKSGNEVIIDTSSGTVRIKGNSRIELKANAGISIDGGGGMVDIRGSMINLN